MTDFYAVFAKSDPFLEAFCRCFPEIESPSIAVYMELGRFLAKQPVPVGDYREEGRHLAAIAHHLNAAFAAYLELHGDVKDELDRQFEINMTKSNSVRIKMTLQVEDREVAVPAHLQNIFAASIYHLTGKFVHPRDSDWEEEDQPSAVAVAAKRARTLLPLTGKSRAEQTWEKVSLVQHAIQCWDRYGQGEPDLGGAKFQDLLQGLSDTVDLDGRRKWDAADLVRSYRRSVKKLEPRNNK